MYNVEILADSKRAGSKHRITTMKITFPRYLLAEFNTHRMFSRNSASSRAIPFAKLLKTVEEAPFVPFAWQKDHSGMQGTEYFTDKDFTRLQGWSEDVTTPVALETLWLKGRDMVVAQAKELSTLNCTKQIINRKLEPYMWHTCIVTATEWENFFFLRCPQYICNYLSSSESVEWSNYDFRSKKDFINFVKNAPESYHSITAPPDNEIDWLKLNRSGAEIHFQKIAEMMWDAYNESTPSELMPGQWHIPMGDNMDASRLPDKAGPIPIKVKIATARCGRVSYTTIGEEGKPDNYEKDLELHDRSVKNAHWSMFEHCARTMTQTELHNLDDDENILAGWSGNFNGFIQYRKLFENENVTI